MVLGGEIQSKSKLGVQEVRFIGSGKPLKTFAQGCFLIGGKNGGHGGGLGMGTLLAGRSV